MAIALVLKIRLYVLNNLLKKISIFKTIVMCVFLLSIVLVSKFIDFGYGVNDSRALFASFTTGSMFNFWALISIYFYLKTILHKNTFRFKGVYNYISIYSSKNLDMLCLISKFEKVIISTTISIFILIFTHGISENIVSIILKVFCMFLLLSCSDFFAKMYTYVVIEPIKKFLILVVNVVIVALIIVVPDYMKLLLVGLSFLLNITIYKLLRFEFEFCLESKKNNEKRTKKLFEKIYFTLKHFHVNKSISYVAAKEIVQIYAEKIPLVYSTLYGVIILIVLPLLSIKTNVREIYTFSYFISVSYTLTGVSLNICARDLKKEWIYKVYNISSFDIMVGKFIGFLAFGLFVNIFYILIQIITGIQLGYCFNVQVLLREIFAIIVVVFPASFFVGGIMGTYFVPKLKYKFGNIDYSYNGAEILILLITTYVVSLPAYTYCYYFINDAVFVSLLVMYQFVLFVLLKNRIELKIFEKE